MLIVVASRWPFPSADTHNDPDVSPRPLIDASLIQGDGRRVVFSRAFVDKH
jgi:hypothetical protein